MQTKLITLVVPLQDFWQGSLKDPPDALRFPGKALPSHIQLQLTQQGEPLRWAITSVDTLRQTAQVEAVVTTD